MKMHNYASFINEMEITDKNIIESIETFHSLQMEILKLQSDLKAKTAEFAKFDKQIQPIIESMKATGDKLAVTEKFVVKVSTFGYSRETASYKDAFNLALTKVNKATQKILNEALDATQKTSKTKATYHIDVNEDNVFTKIADALKNIVSSFLRIFSKEIKVIDQGNDELKKLVS